MIDNIQEKRDLQLQPMLRKRFGKALGDFSMIEEGDRILVGLSGGKDSLFLLAALTAFRKKSPRRFELGACTVDITGGEMATRPLSEFCRSLNVEHFVTIYPISEIIKKREEKSPCSFCANIRRGIISSEAVERGYNVLALGHNLDDVAETVLMNLFQTGRFKSFKPKFWQSRTGLWVIRPLIYIGEKDIMKEAQRLHLPVTEDKCPFSLHTQRSRTRTLIENLARENPSIKKNIIHALSSVRLSDVWKIEQGSQMNNGG
ncbi:MULTISPECIES: tRNA 2-thiocytidine biosynthesis TtcA family protein [Aminobacterium]|jgi:tRNA(Ile)-lysidine synthase TilS/MesJ|uniref:tRNA 2-thiocytidine biosynthesis TtcA family protein n=1 Tax=Aminobacterium TaxID=81466 RepID=UPI00257CD157|nr:ATP-binding protein [Aminobacterium sp. UBA4987]